MKETGFEMKDVKEYTILVPNMAFNQFTLIQAALLSEGYHVELLSTASTEVAQLGLQYVHNDTCYPAVLIIGQFIEALRSGRYDPDSTALAITQSGGGCRASNYIKLLRKALDQAGFHQIPVLSFNFSGLEKDMSLKLTPKLIGKLVAAVEYGDLIDGLYHECKAYEINEGDARNKTVEWLDQVSSWLLEEKNFHIHDMKKMFPVIVKDFTRVPIKRTEKLKVGIVGEIYVKFSPIGNRDLVHFLEQQDCEVRLPGLMGYIEYCIANMKLDSDFYGIKPMLGKICDQILSIVDGLGTTASDALKSEGFHGESSFREIMEKPEGILSLGVKMGEGWLLTAEIIELIESGFTNIVCAQPFGCLPNHIAGKGVIRRIREKYPQANITAVDYDPSSTKVNQENRIRLMLAVGKENLQK